MEERTYYPLSTVQEGLAFLFRFYPDLRILNLAVRMDYQMQINEETLLNAVRETGKRVTFLRVRLHDKDGKTLLQYLSDEEPLPCEIVDVSDRTEEEIDKLLYDWTNSAFTQTILDTQLYFFRLLRLPGGKHALYFCAEHFIIDGYSILFALTYFDQVYAALANGSKLPEPTPLPWAHVEKDRLYYVSEQYQRNLARALKPYETEPHFTSINGLGAPEFIEGKQYGKSLSLSQFDGAKITYPIPYALSERVNEAAKALNISPSVFYFLALREYLGYVSGTDDVTICTTLTNRLTKDEKTTGLDFATMQFLRSVLPGDTRFNDALLQLFELNAETLRHVRAHGVDISQAVHERYGVPFGCSYYTAQYSYLPLVDLDKQYLKFNPSYVSNGQSNQAVYLLIVPDSPNGTLSALYVYSTAYTDPANIERFHAFMLRFLEAGIAEPEKSLRELIDESL